MTGKEIKELLCPSKTRMLLEVINGSWSNSAYLHFATDESPSVFYNKYVNNQLVVNGTICTVEATKYRTEEAVKYLFKELNFAGSSSASTPAAALSVCAPAAGLAAASAHSSDWVASTKRALVSINDDIRELKKRRKYLKKALKKSI